MVNDFRGYDGKGWKGKDTLELYKMDDDTFAFNFLILLIMFIVYRVLFYLFLRMFNRGTRVSAYEEFGLKDFVNKLRHKN